MFGKFKITNLIARTIFFTIWASIVFWGLQISAQETGKPLVLPVRYDAHRFYVEPTLGDGTRLNFFTDTGGGLFVYADVVERFKLPISEIEGDDKRKIQTVALPRFKPGSAIPEPLGSPNRQLFVAPAARRISLDKDWSGMLGQQWFAGRIWTFDYPAQKLLLRAAGDVPQTPATHRVALGFLINSAGKRGANFPRIAVTVAGETLDLLFDTGATTELTATALVAVKDKLPAVRATSFIAANVFERWRAKHPNWRVIEKADSIAGEAMIEVPQVTIGGYTVGAVWFTRRADKNFHEFMSSFMDKRVEGAIGGNALRHFRVTVDYPNAIAVFEK